MYVVVKSDQVAFSLVKTTRTARVIPLCPVISSLLHGSPLLFEPLTLSPQQQQQFTKIQNSHHRHFFYDSSPADTSSNALGTNVLHLVPTLSRNQLPISVVFPITPSLQSNTARLNIHEFSMRHALGFIVLPVDLFYLGRVASSCNGLRYELDEARQVVRDLCFWIGIHEAWSSALSKMLESLVVGQSIVPGSVPCLPDFFVGGHRFAAPLSLACLAVCRNGTELYAFTKDGYQGLALWRASTAFCKLCSSATV
jgi:hypothetical protein